MPDPTAVPPSPGLLRDRATGPASAHPSGATGCFNCGHDLGGRYCPACGQKSEPLRKPAHHFVRDTVAELVEIDGRELRTLGALLLKPGTLTRAYFAGRRLHYVRPLRLYLLSTLAFFFLLSVLDPAERLREEIVRGDVDSVTVAAHLAEKDSLVAGGLAVFLPQADSLIRRGSSGAVQFDLSVRADERDAVRGRAQTKLKRARAESAILRTMPQDSVISETSLHDAMAVLYPDTTSSFGQEGSDGWLDRSAALQRIRASQTDAARADGVVTFLRSAIGHVPTVMFVLLPLFALLLKLLYIRRGWYYAEHVVFGLHTHAFAFVAFSAVTVVAWAGKGSGASVAASLALLAAVPVYVVVAQKRVYGQSWRKSVVKAVLLGSAYSTVFLFGLVAAIVLAAVAG